MIKVNSDEVIEACEKAIIYWKGNREESVAMAENNAMFTSCDIGVGMTAHIKVLKISEIKEMAEYSMKHIIELDNDYYESIKHNIILPKTCLDYEEYNLLRDYL